MAGTVVVRATLFIDDDYTDKEGQRRSAVPEVATKRW
jgi:hypothetical protein